MNFEIEGMIFFGGCKKNSRGFVGCFFARSRRMMDAGLGVLPVLLLFALPGCKGRKADSGRPGDEWTKTAGSDPDEAVSALVMGFEEREQKNLFPESFRFQGESRMKISLEGGEKETLDEQFLVQKSSGDVIRALLDNSREYGWELYWRDEVLFYRNRYMPLQKRPGPRSEAVEGVEKIWNIFPAYWRLFSGFVDMKYGGEDNVAERPARRFEMKLREKPLPWRFAPGADGRKWRKTVRVSRLRGVVHLCKETSLPFSLEFEADYTFNTPQGKKVSAGVFYSHKIEIPADPIEIPDAIDAPVRERESLDRRALLGRLPRPGLHRGGGPVRAWQQRGKKAPRKPRKKIKAE